MKIYSFLLKIIILGGYTQLHKCHIKKAQSLKYIFLKINFWNNPVEIIRIHFLGKGQRVFLKEQSELFFQIMRMISGK